MEVDQLGTHGLSCKRSEGRHHRHSAVHDILHRALRSAKVPARLEPSGLTRSDGKRPDGVTLVPWRRGKPRCHLPRHLSIFIPGQCHRWCWRSIAAQKKLIKYDSLAPNYDIAPVAIESLGAIGPLSRALLKDLGRRIKESTGEARAHEYLVQRLAVAVQRGNAVSIMGTMEDPGQRTFLG